MVFVGTNKENECLEMSSDNSKLLEFAWCQQSAVFIQVFVSQVAITWQCQRQIRFRIEYH